MSSYPEGDVIVRAMMLRLSDALKCDVIEAAEAFNALIGGPCGARWPDTDTDTTCDRRLGHSGQHEAVSGITPHTYRWQQTARADALAPPEEPTP